MLQHKWVVLPVNKLHQTQLYLVICVTFMAVLLEYCGHSCYFHDSVVRVLADQLLPTTSTAIDKPWKLRVCYLDNGQGFILITCMLSEKCILWNWGSSSQLQKQSILPIESAMDLLQCRSRRWDFGGLLSALLVLQIAFFVCLSADFFFFWF